jgi:P22 coat protein - gene protein 5
MANNLAAFNSEAWSERLVTKLDQINVMLPLVNRNWEGDLRQNKTVHIRTPGNITMGSYSRGGTISYQDLVPTNESFTVNDGEYFAFEVDDLDKAQSDVNAMDVYLKRAVVAMNNTVESKLLSAYSSAGVALGAPSPGSGAILTPVVSGGVVTSVTITAGGSGYTSAPVIQFVGGTGNGATATCTVSSGAINAVTVTAGGNNYTVAPYVVLTTGSAVTLTTSTGTTVSNTDVYPQFVQARSVLSKANVPSSTGARWAVVDPDTTGLLLQDTEHFVRAGELGDKVVQYGLVGGDEVARTAAQAPGFVGMVAGFSVYETPHVPTSGGNKFLLFGDNEAISYAAQITEIEALRLQTTFANAVRGLLLHDIYVFAENSKRLVSLKCTP